MLGYQLGELQEVIDTLQDFFDASKSKEERRLIANLYEKIAQHYNLRAKKKIFNKTIYNNANYI